MQNKNLKKVLWAMVKKDITHFRGRGSRYKTNCVSPAEEHEKRMKFSPN